MEVTHGGLPRWPKDAGPDALGDGLGAADGGGVQGIAVGLSPEFEVRLAQGVRQADVTKLDVRAELGPDQFTVERQLQIGPALRLLATHKLSRDIGGGQILDVLTREVTVRLCGNLGLLARRAKVRFLRGLGLVGGLVVEHTDYLCTHVPVDAVDAATHRQVTERDRLLDLTLRREDLPALGVPGDLPVRQGAQPVYGAIDGQFDSQPGAGAVALTGLLAKALLQPAGQLGPVGTGPELLLLPHLAEHVMDQGAKGQCIRFASEVILRFHAKDVSQVEA